MRTIIKPGETIGIIGGGQLGRMLTFAASSLGFKTVVLSDREDTPAATCSDEFICGSYHDAALLDSFSSRCAAITYEFENIPFEVVQYLETRARLRPGSGVLAVTGDRLAEKAFLTTLGIAVADFHAISYEGDVKASFEAINDTLLLKTRRYGYDGKGQAAADSAAEAIDAYETLESEKAVAEQFVAFKKEFSIVAVRGEDGEFITYDPAENTHQDGMLRRSVVPADIPNDVTKEASRITQKIADALRHIGVIAVEFFLTEDNRILVNEIAPRVHNSGHWTANACQTGQFEQHIRAVCGWPLGSARRHSDVIMRNIIGEEVNNWEDYIGDAVCLYGKSDVLPNRKMGHVTTLSPIGK